MQEHHATLRRFILAIALTAGVIAGFPTPAQAQSASPADLAAMKERYRRPPARPVENQSSVDLGRMLFWDPRISASGKTTCASCHFPYLGWSVTDARSRSDSGRPTSRKSQPLIGLGHVKDSPFGWDGRNPTLEAQVLNSIATGSMSMQGTAAPVKTDVIEERIRAIADYVTAFSKALPNTPITMESIARAIAEYERGLEPGIAPFDRWIGGDEGAISESARRGFALFNGAAGCASCHSGWRFTDDSFHDIGTSKTDPGRGRELKDAAQMQYAFKTPTLRSVALRPPYMHNASAMTLYDVVRHYERGGIERPSRSSDMLPFSLTEKDRLDLVAFMQTLTGIPEGEAEPKLP